MRRFGHLPWLVLAPLAAALCSLVALNTFAPGYLLHAGFPLDDAWIHAVYARELARTGSLAYNPGVAATGETAPAWALILAVLHRLTSDVSSVVAMTKAVGFGLHVLSAILVALAFSGRTRTVWPGLVGGVLVAVHPDLVAASVSGMEVPLATAVIAALAATVFGGSQNPPEGGSHKRSSVGSGFSRISLVAVLAAIAFAARPEIVVIAILLPLLVRGRLRLATGMQMAVAAAAGATVSMAVLAIRNMVVSGMPLPATFYAKAHTSSLFDPGSQVLGWVGEVGEFPLVGTPLLLVGLPLVAAVLVARRQLQEPVRIGAALYLAGIVFCAVSFALAPPADPAAFYWQRYILPALLPMLAATPLLAAGLIDMIPGRPREFVYIALAACLIVVMAPAAPTRFRRLASDTRNIDDVQVQFGRALADASPSDVAWVVDAGASRYFGRAFVVDLVGLNTPMMLGAQRQAFLDAHPPSYLDVFAGWSRIEGRWPSATPARVFGPSTPYTVAASAAMREHVLVSCEPPGFQGRLRIGRRAVDFRCAQ